ncbi:MAG: uracil-DNA glycosylase [Acidimicrobiia bacterium]|nr:uracil-DNA glycosylase [Acidimicrobiia bacterium]
MGGRRGRSGSRLARGQRYDCVVPTLLDIEAEARTCVRCPLSEGRTQVVFGVGNPDADLMFVGEAPGREEDLKGEPFVGRAGKLLDQLVLEEMGLTRDSFYIANTLMCRPPGNRDPRPEETAACRPWLQQKIELINPKVIVTLGNFATKLLLDTTQGITKVRGQTYRYGEATLVPTFHPSAALQGGGGDVTARMRADLVRAKRELSRAPC